MAKSERSLLASLSKRCVAIYKSRDLDRDVSISMTHVVYLEIMEKEQAAVRCFSLSRRF